MQQDKIERAEDMELLHIECHKTAGEKIRTEFINRILSLSDEQLSSFIDFLKDWPK